MDAEGTAGRYIRFARREADGISPCYEAWAQGVAGDAELLSLLDALPTAKRQPNLLFAAARFLGAEAGSFAAFRAWLLMHWDEASAVMLARRTQTNEVGRCAVLLPVLASLPQPLALIEVGASAGLCLFPDRYSYLYDERAALDPVDGLSPVVLRCRTNGQAPLLSALPTVVWRAGIDLDPVDLSDPEQGRWLEALVWPEAVERLQRLRAAVAIVRRQQPPIVRGDLNEEIASLLAEAPANATAVVFHSAVLAYVEQKERRRWERTMRRLACRWIANEAEGVLEPVPATWPVSTRMAVSVDGKPVAHAGPHGDWLQWLHAAR